MPLRTIIIKATRSGTASTVIIRRGASGTGTGGGTSDHGALTGLGDDDHPQYAKVAITNNFTAAQNFSQPVYLSGAVMGVVTTPIAGAYNGPGTGLTGTAQDLIVGQAFTANALTGILPITSGGTGGATASAARTALGLGTANAVQFGVISTTEQPLRIPLVYSNASDFLTGSTAFVDVTGLSFPVIAGKNYQVMYWLVTNKNDGNGMQIQFTGPAAPVKFLLRHLGSIGSLGSASIDIITAFNSPPSAFNAYTGDGFAFSSAAALLTNGPNAGTVKLQLRTITGGTAKIYAGSWMQVTQLN